MEGGCLSVRLCLLLCIIEEVHVFAKRGGSDDRSSPCKSGDRKVLTRLIAAALDIVFGSETLSKASVQRVCKIFRLKPIKRFVETKPEQVAFRYRIQLMFIVSSRIDIESAAACGGLHVGQVRIRRELSLQLCDCIGGEVDFKYMRIVVLVILIGGSSAYY